MKLKSEWWNKERKGVYWKNSSLRWQSGTIRSLTSWYIDGLDRDGIVKERSLLLPSLSTISWKTTQREEETVKLCHRVNAVWFTFLIYHKIYLIWIKTSSLSQFVSFPWTFCKRQSTPDDHSAGACYWLWLRLKRHCQHPLHSVPILRCNTEINVSLEMMPFLKALPDYCHRSL